MRTRSSLLLIALLTSVLAVTSSSASGRAARCSDVMVAAKASGTTVKLKRCDELTITLSEASDGGYEWTVSQTPGAKILKLVSNTAVRVGPVKRGPYPIVGGNDNRVIVYKAIGKGKTSLKLTESRSFQRGSTIASFSLAVHVTKH